MSVAGHLSGNPDKIFHKPTHRRNDSGELDVFEAARYFSGSNEIFREDHGSRRGGRMSLDIPIRTNVAPLPPPAYTAAKPTTIKNQKKHREQPSSPGGRLANFLNSLFNQSASKKKKPKSKNEIDEIGGRRRRSSLSTLIDSKSSSNISGFRTPPVQTPNKNYSQIRNIFNQKSKNLGIGIYDQMNRKQNCDREIGKMNGVDDGAESDSSSDLFELRIYDFDCYSSNELPVYETTNIQSINRPSTQL